MGIRADPHDSGCGPHLYRRRGDAARDGMRGVDRASASDGGLAKLSGPAMRFHADDERCAADVPAT